MKSASPLDESCFLYTIWRHPEPRTHKIIVLLEQPLIGWCMMSWQDSIS